MQEQKCENSSNSKQKSVKNNDLNNLNSAIFAMLIQRTTFTVILILSILSFPSIVSADIQASSTFRSSVPIVVFDGSFAEENAIERPKKEEILVHSPVFIPLTEPSPIPETITVGKPTKREEYSKFSPESMTIGRLTKREEFSTTPRKYYPETLTVEKPTKTDDFSSSSRKFSNESFNTGNTLWDGLLNECMVKPSVSCIQKNVYTFLDSSLGISGDVNVTEGFLFKKNKLASWKYSEKANKKKEDNMVDGGNSADLEDEEEARHSGNNLFTEIQM